MTVQSQDVEIWHNASHFLVCLQTWMVVAWKSSGQKWLLNMVTTLHFLRAHQPILHAV